MAGGTDIGNGHRIGGQVDRQTVADRLAARAAPLTVAARPAANPAPAPAGEPKPTSVVAPPVATGDDELVPFSPIRRRTAEHLRRSLDTAVHALVVTEVDYSAVDAVRRDHQLTYLPFVARAVVRAVQEFPQINASVTDEGLSVHHHVGLGVAVDLDFEGLVVPVVHDADDLRLPALAVRIDDVAHRARVHQLAMADLEGGTITVTNVGSYGTVMAAPIINHPQVAIVSTDGVRVRPVAVRVDDDWALAFRPMGNLSLSFDHRAFDGAYATAFIARVRELLEQSAWEEEL